MLDKRAQGRPARGASAVGPTKIVEGMQAALRSLQTSNVTRRDIARFAGVTPALVTYYFPERNTLIEAATVPVVENLATSIRERLAQHADPKRTLLYVISDLLQCYSTDITIVELYISHYKSESEGSTQDKLQALIDDLTTFFEKWLARSPRSPYDARFLTNALLGLCRSVVHHHGLGATMMADQDVEQRCFLKYAEMIYQMLISSLPGEALAGRGGFDWETSSSDGVATNA